MDSQLVFPDSMEQGLPMGLGDRTGLSQSCWPQPGCAAPRIHEVTGRGQAGPLLVMQKPARGASWGPRVRGHRAGTEGGPRYPGRQWAWKLPLKTEWALPSGRMTLLWPI